MEKKQERNNRIVTSELTIEEKLKRILNLFFGMNPRNKFWLLEVLLLAKRGQIVICENEMAKDDLLLCEVDTDLLSITAGTEKTIKEWKEKGIRAKYAVGRTTERIKKLLLEIENSFTYREEGESNIFNMKQMEPLDLMEIILIINSLPSDWFKSGVCNFAEEVLSYIQRNIGGKGGLFFQPTQVSRLFVDLLAIEDGTVYNPYAGFASYGTLLNEKVEYHAQEINQIYLIARLNLLLHGKDDSNCIQGDSLSEWEEEPVDYIVASPPFNARIQDGAYHTMEADFFARSYIQARKKVAAIVSGSFISVAGGDVFALRKTFVEKDLVESVIMLPDNIFYGTGLPAFIVILNKEKEHKGRIKFVNAFYCRKKQGIMNVLDVDMALGLFNGNDKYHTALVGNEVVLENMCSFAPSRYIARMLPDAKEGEKYVPLSDFLRPIPRNRAERGKDIIPRVQFPKEDIKLLVKSSDLPKEGTADRGKFEQIFQDCIIIDVNKQIRSIYLQIDGVPAYAYPIYKLFTVDISAIDPEYLVLQFRQPYMTGQLVVARSSYDASVEDILTAQILLPPLEAQKEIVLKFKEKFIEELGFHLNDLNKKRLEDLAVTQRERKHAVSQVLDDILPAIELIGDFIQENYSFSRDSVVSRRGATFGEYISKLIANVNKVSHMVGHFTDSDKFHAPSLINVEDSICAYIRKKIAKGYEVVMEYLDEGEMIVNVSEEDLHQVFDNLIKNAEKYGFVDKSRFDYKVKITVSSSEDGQKTIIHVRNNGVPASKDFDIKKIFAWGEGHGTGIGCNQVKHIIEHFGGSVTYQEMEDDADGFVCDFEIILPINNESDNG